MTPFKVEIFDCDYNLIDYSVIDTPNIAFDYLTLESFELTLPKIATVNRSNYVIISNGNEKIYNGIVKAVSISEGMTSLTLRPLLSIFDVKCYFNRDDLKSQTLEQFLKNIIESLYKNTDDLQQIKGIRVNINSNTSNANLGLTENIHNLWEIFILAFNKYGIIVSSDLDIANEMLLVTIDKVSDVPNTIEADLPTIIDPQFTLRDDFGKVNKITLINKKNETEKLTFISPDFKRPVVFTYEYIDSDNFKEDAQNKAIDVFTPDKFDNLIEFTTTVDNPLVDCNIGDNTNIIYKGVQYSSALTGFEITGKIKKYVFGAVRLDLTKILKLENRRKKEW